jgi:uroporphyrinogen-III synthase
MGLQARAFPIFTIQAVPWTPVPRETVDAVILGSANAVRHGGAHLTALRGLPAYCVGQTTAKAAEVAGFEVVRVGSGGLQHVLTALAPEHRRLLRLSGVAHVPLSLPPGVTMETRTVYDAVAMPLSQNLKRALQGRAVVMLHSGEAASHFDAICADADVERSRIKLATIGPRVTRLVGPGWAEVRTAGQPADAALLALAAQMCQDPPDAGR